jgi:endonuclease/exonuclease/phosphatase family metal-dependent hydrolase
MRVATYNIWRDPRLWPARLDAICEEVSRVGADLLALQEVGTVVGDQDRRNVAECIATQAGYDECRFWPYPNRGEGLAILSRLPFIESEAGWETELREAGCAVRAVAQLPDGRQLGITNIHAPSFPRPVVEREAACVAVARWVEARAIRGRHELLLGDFNFRPESSVYRFLRGEQSLLGYGVRYLDLAVSHASRTGTIPRPTIDQRTNPRWRDEHTLEEPLRFDWILLRESWPDPVPYLDRVEIFGAEPSPQAGLVPSDHYGLLADLRWPAAVG